MISQIIKSSTPIALAIIGGGLIWITLASNNPPETKAASFTAASTLLGAAGGLAQTNNQVNKVGKVDSVEIQEINEN